MSVIFSPLAVRRCPYFKESESVPSSLFPPPLIYTGNSDFPEFLLTLMEGGKT